MILEEEKLKLKLFREAVEIEQFPDGEDLLETLKSFACYLYAMKALQKIYKTAIEKKEIGVLGLLDELEEILGRAKEKLQELRKKPKIKYPAEYVIDYYIKFCSNPT